MVKIPSGIRLVLTASIACALIAPAAMAQSADANEQAYHNLLEQIANKKISIAQQEVFVAGFDARIVDLSAQIEALPETTEAVSPMIDKMVAAIGREIEADFPFMRDERLARLNKLKGLVADDAATIGSKYRSALNIYKIEVNYGSGLDAYPGNHPDPAQATVRQGDDRYQKDEDGKIELNKTTGLPVEAFDGDYLRYGRAAFVYVNKDGSSPLRYDLEAKSWVELKGAASELRRAIRVSYGEVPPGVVMAPVMPMP